MTTMVYEKLQNEFINSLGCEEKDEFWGDLAVHRDELLELRRNGGFRYPLFDAMKYKPHPAQREFHDAFPQRIRNLVKEGQDQNCPHPAWHQAEDPDERGTSIDICKRCQAVYKTVYHNRFRCVIAAARWGKSLAVGKEGCLPLLWPGINPDGTLNREKAPRVYIYAPSYAIGRHEFFYILDAMLELNLEPNKLQTSWQSGNLYAKWSWGAELLVKSWDNEKSLLGDEIDVAVISEGSKLKYTIFERYIRARMGSRNAYCIMGSTPAGIGEFLESFYERGQKENDIEVWSGMYGLLTNPHHDQADYYSAKAAMDPKTFAEQYEGKFITMSGLVFDNFDRETHIKEQIKKKEDLPGGARVIFGIDFGRSTYTAAAMTYWDKDGTLHVLGEYYQKDAPIKEHFHSYLKDWLIEWRPEYLVYDYAQPEAAQFLYDEIFKLQQAGVLGHNECIMSPCVKGKTVGIERVRQLLHFNTKLEFSKFEVDPSCTNMFDEFRRYVYKETAAGITDDKPAKGHDHLMDCLEYISADTYEDGVSRRVRGNMIKEGEDRDRFEDSPGNPLKSHFQHLRRKGSFEDGEGNIYDDDPGEGADGYENGYDTSFDQDGEDDCYVSYDNSWD